MSEHMFSHFQILYNKYKNLKNAVNASNLNHREIYIAPVSNSSTRSSTVSSPVVRRHQPNKSHKMCMFDVKHLCQVKESPWHVIRQKRLRPTMGPSCSACTPVAYFMPQNDKATLKNLLDIYSFGSIKKSMFGYFVDNIKLFHQLKTHEFKYIFNEVLEDEVVVNAINATAHRVCIDNVTDGDSRFREELKIQQENTKIILSVMCANVKSWVYKFMAWFAFRMVSLLATSVVVQSSQIDTVKKAEQSGLPVIYLPLHKSHMDYILLGLVLTMHNIKPPLVAARENLGVFFINKLLNYFGVFFIKRNIDMNKDHHYWSILKSYIKNRLKEGHHIEFFLEGSRTQSGKCCVPNGDLLSIIIEACHERIIEDAWIIPVSMNYERLLEENFVREQLGQPKKKETFFASISTFIKAIFSNYGIMRVDFNVPLRLRDLYESIYIKTKSVNEMFEKQGQKISENFQYKQILDGMAIHIVYDCWKSTAIMSTNAVSFLLLRKCRNGTTLEYLANELTIMRSKLERVDRDVGFSGLSIDVVTHALNLLGPKLVVFENNDAGYIVKPVLSVSSLIELSYYGNNLLSHYLHQSIVALAISKLVGPEFWKGTLTETCILRNDLNNCVLFLIGLFQFDFVFLKPCVTLNNIIDSVIRCFVEEGIISINLLHDEEKRSHRRLASLCLHDIKFLHVNSNKSSLNQITFYRSIIMPYLECMAECAGSFLVLEHNSVPELEHVQTILNKMHEDLKEGVLSYGESISIDTIKHSFLAFEKFNCLEIIMMDNIKTLSMNGQAHDFYSNMQYTSDYIEELINLK